MKKNKKLTQERLRELLDYDHETGIFRWKVGRQGTAGKGSIAGCKNGHGYIYISIDGTQYRAHRLAWLFVYGYWSENNIDHENKVKTDNRICNLREASQQCNMRNTSNFSHNSSGVKGVYWFKRANKWMAYIKVNGKMIYLGYYDNRTDAARARYEKEKELGWSGCDSSSPAYLYLKEQGEL